ncbi:putative peptidoglycan glycosyltransferase FtsW [Opitutus sp. GAS368]|jgi:cell division protein FtsW|uniref:FtsW/RodA/SpoVE family cell cycle protein n=1 Tax=Opitutus sp. GAS368 TaxID=1882749 RepID=UPI00087B32AD|nr:putative peptidoglycan glycosyltransferase FtsW [Opitutus sp. GAS368]SDR67054.1 cell division protein FtsW [Opitutus sp. GAS368]
MVGSPSAAVLRRPLTITPASVIVVCVAALVSLGLVVLFSASSPIKGGPYAYLYKQFIFLALAIGAGWLVAIADLEHLRRFAWVVAAVSLVSLVLVLFTHPVNGSHRWLGIGGLGLQMTEFAKFALIFSLAHYLAVNQSRLHDFWRGFVLPLAWIGVFALLAIVEPDFGAAMLLGAIGVILLYLAGARLKFLLPCIGTALLGFIVLVANNPVRLQRVLSFLDPEANRQGTGYQPWQALLAFAAGGVDGVGLGNGRQQNAFLPEAHTDYIFAIMGEEMGLIFTLLTVALFVTIFVAGLMHVRRAPNLFQFLLVTGCVLLITLQAIINLGVVTSLLPSKGMSLPFISAGGSNLLLMGLLVGVIINSQRTWERPKPLVRKRSLTEVIA